VNFDVSYSSWLAILISSAATWALARLIDRRLQFQRFSGAAPCFGTRTTSAQPQVSGQWPSPGPAHLLAARPAKYQSDTCDANVDKSERTI